MSDEYRAALLAYRAAKEKTKQAEAACVVASDALRAAENEQREAYIALADARQAYEESIQ